MALGNFFLKTYVSTWVMVIICFTLKNISDNYSLNRKDSILFLTSPMPTTVPGT